MKDYINAKKTVKEWEDEYVKEHNERPNRVVLQEAPGTIREAYKIYWKYRKSKNQESLLKENLFDSPLSKETGEDSRSDTTFSENIPVKDLNDSVKNSINSENEMFANSEQKYSDEIKKNSIWGKHLNISLSHTSTADSKKAVSLYSKMAEKMRSNPIVKTRVSLKRLPSQNNITSSLNKSEDKFKCSNDSLNNVNLKDSKDDNFELPVDSLITSKNKIPFKNQALSISTHSSNTPTLSMSKCDKSWVSRCLNGFSNELNVENENLNNLVASDVGIEFEDGRNFANLSEKKEFPRASKRKCEDSFYEQRLHSPKVLKKADNFSTSSFVANPIINYQEEINHTVFMSADIKNSCSTNKFLPNKDGNEPCDNSQLVQIGSSYKDYREQGLTPESERQDITSKRSSCNSNQDSNQMVTLANSAINRNITESYDELLDMETKEIQNPQKKHNYCSKEERLAKKISSGKANDNYIKINLKKKVFVRGKKRMTSKQYKRQEWKKKKQNFGKGSSSTMGTKLTCFNCGDFGHWASKCPGKLEERLMPLLEYDDQESTFLSLEEAALLATGVKPKTSSNSILNNVVVSYLPDDSDSKKSPNKELSSDDNLSNKIDLDNLTDVATMDENIKPIYNTPVPNVEPNLPTNRSSIEPLFSLKDGKIIQAPDIVLEALKEFGYNNFRPGQERTIMRVLSGLSTLLVLSTGSGKSLCYQLPAYLYAKHYKCITLCISPLVSLMEDQVTGLPPFLKAVCLHTQQNNTSRAKALDAIRSGAAHILLISPEAVVASNKGGVLGTLLKELPPIAFVCLDEAHCLSQWSHNFRPSYLQICQVLKNRLKVTTILGLTATARHETSMNIAQSLEISDLESGVIIGSCIPLNLKLSVSRDPLREEALVNLLKGSRFSSCTSIIIYCTRREQCEKVAAFLRTQLLDTSQINPKSNAKRARGVSLDAEAYHAGLSAYRRQTIQKRFMSGRLRIVVATVAFGMGIDKADVEGIIHFNMPKNLESYVQEIGRAGRDGRIAHCHLFLDAEENKDIQELKRHIFSDSVDRFTIRKLLNKVFVPCACVKANKSASDSSPSENSMDSCSAMLASANRVSICPTHEVALPIAPLVEALDLPEENIQTLLCYLQLRDEKCIKLSNHVYASCKISCYKGPKQLRAVSINSPPLAAAIAIQRSQGVSFEKKSFISFQVVELAARMGWQSGIVKQELKRLEWNTNPLQGGGNIQQTGVKVEFCDLAFHLNCRGDLIEEEQDEILAYLHQRDCQREKDQLKQLHHTYQTLRSVSHSSILLCCNCVDEDRCLKLKESIKAYFEEGSDALDSIMLEERLYLRPEIEARVRGDIRSLLATHADVSWTGRAVARIFHGISSPNFPSKTWCRVRKFWRLHLELDFNLLVTIATKEILKFK